MLGRVPLTDHHLPVSAANRQCLSVAEALVVVGQRRGELAKAAKALPVILQLLVGESGAVSGGENNIAIQIAIAIAKPASAVPNARS